MLIDFEDVHRTYLVGKSLQSVWQFTPTNPSDPRKGMIVCSHTVFSNHALQVAIHLYNRVGESGKCTSVSHCLLLCFSHKVDGRYPLNNDEERVTFHLDLGVASELYALATGHSDAYTYRAVRKGRAPKTIEGSVFYRDGSRGVRLRAVGVTERRNVSLDVELDRADQIALAAHCLGYGRLLYPSFSDVAVQDLLTPANPKVRACAENSTDDRYENTAHPNAHPASADPPSQRSVNPSTTDLGKLRRVIWAIGNQKWQGMQLDALQRIQKEENAGLLQALINEANDNNFAGWDAYLR